MALKTELIFDLKLHIRDTKLNYVRKFVTIHQTANFYAFIENLKLQNCI